MARGGRQPGAGRPKGRKNEATIDREWERELHRRQVLAERGAMTEAQIAHAKGLRYLVARHKTTGKFTKLTEELMQVIASGENPEYEAIEVWSKDPSVQAYTDLMNRALDKPKEQMQDIHITGQINIVDVLRQRHQRQIASHEVAEILKENGTLSPSGD